jgi:uncharacterized membrane protein
MTEQTEDSAREDSETHDGGTEPSETHVSAAHSSEPGENKPDADEVAREVEFISAERLIFFTDAVVAIAMTLLAFGLTTHIADNASDHAALAKLWADHAEYLAFLIGFVVISSHWRTHHRLFRDVARLDARIITLNMIWLLMIVIMPFATRLLSGAGGFAIVFSLYAIIQIITITMALLMSRHITAAGLLRPGAPEPRAAGDDATALTFAAMFAISIPVAFAPDQGTSQWVFVIWVAAAPAARLVRRLRQRA